MHYTIIFNSIKLSSQIFVVIYFHAKFLIHEYSKKKSLPVLNRFTVFRSILLTPTKYCKIQKNLDTRKNYCNYPKIFLKRIFHRVMCLNNADGMANRAETDQTATLGAV